MTKDPAADELARAIAEGAPEGLVAVDAQGVIVFVNAQAEAMFGHRRDALIGRPIEVLVPDRHKRGHPELRKAFTRRPKVKALPSQQGLVGRHRDGTEFPIDLSLSPIKTSRGSFIVAAVRAAPSRPAVLASLREAEEDLRVTLDEAPIATAIVSLDGGFLRVNKSLCRILGYTASELAALSFEAITHPGDVATERAFTERLLRREIATQQLDVRYLKKDGSIVETASRRSVVRDAAGAPLHFIVQAEDVGETRRAQRELERSAERFRDLFDQAPDAIFIVDRAGRFTELNPAACALLGFAREELIGTPSVDLVPPENLERLERAREELRVEGRLHVGEWALRRKDGSYAALEVSAKDLPDGGRQVFARDVGARRRDEAALKASEAALQRAQRVARVASWDWDLETDEISHAKFFYELLGVEASSNATRAYQNFGRIPAEQRVVIQRAVDEAIRDGTGYTVEHAFVRPDGKEVIVRQQGEPIFEGGRPVRMTGTLLDITELRRAEREREKSLRLFRAVFDQCPVGIVLVQGDRVEANRQAEALLGLPAAPVGAYPDMLLGLDRRPLPVEDWPSNRVRRGERVDGLELYLQRPDRTLVPLMVSAAPLLGSTGAIEGAVIVGQDVTAAKQLERLRAEWSSIIAHDLRQPLNAIALSCHLLAGATRHDPDLYEATERIAVSAKRLSRMVHDIMDLSRLEAARLDLAREPVDLVALARASVAEVALDPANPPVELRTRGVVPPVLGDHDRLMQVMTNLLTNASKYGRAGAPVLVDVASSGPEVSVAITNDGEGIAPEDVPRLFQRFERAEHARQSGIPGVGLGLHITRGLIEAHGGKIEVESTPGATTTFRFTLPAE